MCYVHNVFYYFIWKIVIAGTEEKKKILKSKWKVSSIVCFCDLICVEYVLLLRSVYRYKMYANVISELQHGMKSKYCNTDVFIINFDRLK